MRGVDEGGVDHEGILHDHRVGQGLSVVGVREVLGQVQHRVPADVRKREGGRGGLVRDDGERERDARALGLSVRLDGRRGHRDGRRTGGRPSLEERDDAGLGVDRRVEERVVTVRDRVGEGRASRVEERRGVDGLGGALADVLEHRGRGRRVLGDERGPRGTGEDLSGSGREGVGGVDVGHDVFSVRSELGGGPVRRQDHAGRLRAVDVERRSAQLRVLTRDRRERIRAQRLRVPRVNLRVEQLGPLTPWIRVETELLVGSGHHPHRAVEARGVEGPRPLREIGVRGPLTREGPNVHARVESHDDLAVRHETSILFSFVFQNIAFHGV